MDTVRESTVIDAPVGAVWALLRDFNSHDRWHPAIASSRIEDGLASQTVGGVRYFSLTDGSILREQLISCSDRDMSLRYCLLDSPLPLMGYVAEMCLRPVTDGDRTLLEWSSTFDPPAPERNRLIALVRDEIYRAGFSALHDWFSGAPQPVKPVAPSKPPSVPPKNSSQTPMGIVIQRHGGPDVLSFQPIELPPVGPNEVRLHQTYVGVNFIDIHCRTGHFDLIDPPGIPGMEAVGIVTNVGTEVSDLRPGDRVGYACAPVGAYCTDRVMPESMLVRLPDRLSDDQAAGTLLKGMTASFLLYDVQPVGPDDIVLIHAASGGVGQLLVQWATALGARVIATASSAEKLEMALSNGADCTINYRQEDFVAATLDLTDGLGANVIFDGVGQSTLQGSLEAAAIRGHVVSFGEASGPPGHHDLGRMSSKSLRFSRPNYGHYVGSAAQVERYSRLLFEAISSGKLRIPSPEIYPLSKAADAQSALEARSLTWSAVLDTSG
ncbi:zinc-binding dehydrogenase [Heliomarina baculiformis]|uniref:zinc-binding dehydrogenase n=1 Tax=Heliomarina baculiformis TaxID=2872036 RepID=UPI001EE2A750|nr:zinc-binding dehydrogenase [Heliomarina baculiformis]